MKLAAIIVNYNCAMLSIATAQMLTDCSDIECIVIVDNYSTDESWSQLSNYQQDSIVAVRAPRNGGYGYGNNLGVQYAKQKLHATHALIVNPDVRVTGAAISELCKCFNKDDIAVASIEQIIPGHGRAVSAWNFYSFSALVCKGGVLGSLYFNRMMDKHIQYYDGIAEVNCVAGPLLMVDIPKFLQVGGYDEDVFLYFEEDILGWKMQQSGYRTISVNSTYYLHLHGETIKRQYDIRKQRALLWKSKRHYLVQYRNASKKIVLLASILHHFGTVELQGLQILRKVTK